MADLEPYPDAIAHLRDELWRVWLRVEYEVRNRLDLGSLPQAVGDPMGVFAAAHTEFVGTARARSDAGAEALLEAFILHSQAITARLQATQDAGRELPLPELVKTFQLTPRQQAALTFTLMPEMDPNLLLALRLLSHETLCRGMDARLLSMLVYDTPDSRAELSLDLSPVSPLFYFRLLEDERDGSLFRRLRPAARLVQVLAGAAISLDPQLVDVARMMPAADFAVFPMAVQRRAEAAVAMGGVLLVLQGQRGVGKRLLAQVAAAGRPVLMVRGRQLAAQPKETARQLVRCLVREALLLKAVPLLADVDEVIGAPGSPEGGGELPEFVSWLSEEFPGTVVLTLSREEMPRMDLRPVIHMQIEVPSLTLRRDLWQHHLPELTAEDAMALAERFATPGGTIAQAARAALAGRINSEPLTIESLDRAVRGQLQDRLARLGRKLEMHYTFEDLIVDDETRDTLFEIVSAVRGRRRVREKWGFRGPPGVSVMFSGDPGVGKTMAATVLTRELGLQVYEIDLSQVTSKWIGETEKNLSELFDAAEPGHVALLFNEADSLFGKRSSEVNSSNDRYANLQTNYLLQRLERFGGLAILTTNLSKAIDPAFRRRFAYDVQFSFPSPEMRAELWRRSIPKKAAALPIDFNDLGMRYDMSGGFIKVAMERAAFLSASLGEPICVESVTIAIERMYRERGKLIARGRLE